MRVYIVTPYYGSRGNNGVTDDYGPPEAAFTDEREAWDYASMGDMTVTTLELE
jgi:hypothetical protein